jgi:Sulfatase-modifying factor enzyme 1/Caspase domain
MQILILDACRNNPFRSLRGGSDGLAAMQAGRGTYIAFAISPGKTAADNPGGSNGLFTGELVTVLREAGLSIDQVFNRVRERVSARSHGEQLPWSTSSVTGEFYFRATIEGSASIPPPPRDLSGERELAFWNSIEDENDAALLEEYLRKYPAGKFAGIAKSKLNRLKAAAAPPPPVVSPPPPVVSQAGERKVNPKDGLTYVWIPPGMFTVGCSPAEAEWEFAARGGSPAVRYGPLDDLAWYDGNSGGKTHEVAQKQPNGYGLYDMLGNVLEWMADWYDKSYYKSSPSSDPQGPSRGQERALRGGSWSFNAGLGARRSVTGSSRTAVTTTWASGALGINSTYRTTPDTGLLAVAYSFFSMRPAR